MPQTIRSSRLRQVEFHGRTAAHADHRRRTWVSRSRRCDGAARNRVGRGPAILLTNCSGCLPVNEVADNSASGKYRARGAQQGTAFALKTDESCTRGRSRRWESKAKLAAQDP